MGLSFRPNENAGDLCLFDSLMLASEGGQRDQMLSHYKYSTHFQTAWAELWQLGRDQKIQRLWDLVSVRFNYPGERSAINKIKEIYDKTFNTSDKHFSDNQLFTELDKQIKLPYSF